MPRLVVALVALPLVALPLVLACGAPTPRPRAARAEKPRVTSANTVVVPGATLTLHYEGVPPNGSRTRFEEWVREAAEMVVDYCGGSFPVPDLSIEIVVRPYGDVGFGQHFSGRRLRIRVGSDVDRDTLRRDWVMVHEMLHTALPDLPRRHRWMQEGLSTYLESVTRARAGYVSEAEVWDRWARRMPYGQPEAGDRGLDRTPTWGRVYWGGALFWLTVDVELRRRSQNRIGLEHVVRGILARGGNSRADWSTAQVVRAGDEATSMTVLSEIYAAQAERPGRVDLDRLFEDLGLRADAAGRMVLDDDAELASVRRAITGPR